MTDAEFDELIQRSGAVFVSLSAAAGGGGKSLSGLKVPRQCGHNWCWAAVTEAVDDFYATPGMAQCEVVNNMLSKTNCCDCPPAPPDCDVRYKLSPALASVSHFQDMFADAATFSVTKNEIDGGRPLCMAIQISANTNHFTVLYGYTDGPDPQMLIDCSIYGKTSKPFGALVGMPYSSGAEWFFTYRTKP